jgi:hypothetical protein
MNLQSSRSPIHNIQKNVAKQIMIYVSSKEENSLSASLFGGLFFLPRLVMTFQGFIIWV